MTHPDVDEWEYEYDETDTEHLYISLDLSNVPGAQIPMSQGKFGHPTLLKSRLRALNAARGQPTDFSTAVPHGQENATMGEVQVTGLHTTNPLLMYNGQLLTCHWTATIGTDMFFVKPDAGIGEPLRSLPSVDLVSLGSAKLVARPGRLRPRDDLFEDAGDGSQAVGKAASVHNNHTVQESQPVPTSFLAKLNLAKAKRGEKTRLAASETSEGTRLVSEPVREQVGVPGAGSSHPSGDATMGGT